MEKPVLIVMAAGLGSRYGGLKQIAPVDGRGHILMDYAVYDAKRAGFETIICVLRPGMENDFRELCGNRMERGVTLCIAEQKLENLPHGFELPAGRVKPWGTAHAVLCAKDFIKGPFAVINADDFYGAEAFQNIYNFLSDENLSRTARHAMIGYKIENTITENGSVARGVCSVDGSGKLTEIIEHTRIEKCEGGAESLLDDGSKIFLPEGTIVSMNLWGFGASMMEELEIGFADFLNQTLPANPLKAEYFLPSAANSLLNQGKAEISTLTTNDKWYGVTYAEDMPKVQKALAELRSAGKYPEELWTYHAAAKEAGL